MAMLDYGVYILGPPVEYAHRAGLDHDPLPQETTPAQLAWARDRLAGKPWASNCKAAIAHH